MGASSVTGTGHGSADRNLSEVRLINQTLKLRAHNNLPMFGVVDRHYVARNLSSSEPSPGDDYDDSIFRMAFTSSDGSDYEWDGTTLVVTHNLGMKYVATITIYDDNDYMILPDEVQPVDENTLNIELSTFAPIAGTYHFIIMR